MGREGGGERGGDDKGGGEEEERVEEREDEEEMEEKKEVEEVENVDKSNFRLARKTGTRTLISRAPGEKRVFFRLLNSSELLERTFFDLLLLVYIQSNEFVIPQLQQSNF